MTVHTMRQITALQRANMRWRNPRRAHALQIKTRVSVGDDVVSITPPPKPTLRARINHAVTRAEASRITWQIITAVFVLGYAWVCTLLYAVINGPTP